MKQTIRRILPRTAGMLLAVSLCLSGCQNAEMPSENDDSPAFSQLKEEFYQAAASFDYLTQKRLVKDPETAGLSVCYPSFPDFSENAWKEELDLAKSLRFQLNTIDSTALDSQDQFLFQILSEYADCQLEKEGMESFRVLSLLSPESGLMVQVPRILGTFSFETRQDVEDYFTLLSDLPRLFKDLADLARQEVSDGLVLTPEWIQDAENACSPYCLDTEHNSLSLSFSRQLEGISDLTPEERTAYEEQHQKSMDETVIPSFQKLAQDIRSLSVQTMKQEGLCGRTGGQAFYRHLVRSLTGTSYRDISQIKSILEEQLQNNTRSMNRLLAESPDLRASSVSAFDRFSDADQLLSFLQEETEKHFPETGDSRLTASLFPEELTSLWDVPGFFTPARDQTMENQNIWVSQSMLENPSQLYPALAQSAYPGAFYRESWLRENLTDPVRQVLSFPGWEKGWDLYARSYSFSFENGLSRQSRQLVRLTLSSSLTVRALIDIQVNYYGWGQEEVQKFLEENYGVSHERVAESIYRSAVYSPCQSLASCIGYLEIRQMKTQAAETLGQQFNEMEFHRFLLETGPAPFSLIRSRLDTWITSQNMNALTR